MYYHVRLDYYDSKLRGNQTKYGFDYESEDEVVAEVLTPYLNKKDFFFHGCSVSGDGGRKLMVYQTDQPINSVVSYANARHNNPLYDYDAEGILEYPEYAKDITRSLFNKYEKAVKEQKKPQVIEKPKKVFISHSHKDEEFAMALVDLLHDIGFDYEEIFCSSAPACSIPEGKSIFDEIRAQFEKYDLFVIFIHSPRFYDSHMSMNEMGAAWVLRADYSSFLTKDMTTDLMKKAVVRDDRIYIQIGDKNALYRLTEWQERILEFFHKPSIKTNAWMQDSAKFLEIVSNLSYSDSSENESNPKHKPLSEEDKRRLRSWVNSNDETMCFTDYTGEGGFVILGSVEYPIKSARDKTEWYAYFKRLLSLGLVEYRGLNGNNPVYQLTAEAYKYFDR